MASPRKYSIYRSNSSSNRNVVPICPACKARYGPEIFPGGTLFQSDRWLQPTMNQGFDSMNTFDPRGSDLDWYAEDSTGSCGHFTSGGSVLVPKDSINSLDGLIDIHDYF